MKLIKVQATQPYYPLANLHLEDQQCIDYNKVNGN